jgi:putative transposase
VKTHFGVRRASMVNFLSWAFKVSERTVSRFMPKHRPRGNGGDWMNFLRNQSRHIVAVDFMTVFTATFKQLRAMIVLSHDRREILHVGVAAQNNFEWLRNQFLAAFPGECQYRYLVCDNDTAFGLALRVFFVLIWVWRLREPQKVAHGRMVT